MNVGRGGSSTTHSGLRAKEPTQNAGNVTQVTRLCHTSFEHESSLNLICVQHSGDF